MIELKMDSSNQKKLGGPTLKLSSSKLGTCQGQNSITLAHRTPFRNHFLIHVWPSLQVLPICRFLQMYVENKNILSDLIFFVGYLCDSSLGR